MDAAGRDFAALFEPEPSRWGLRGDPHLWREMRAHLEGTPILGTDAQLGAHLAAAFAHLTGRPLETAGSIRVERFPRSGMSGGQVSPSWWRETGLPLLVSRVIR